VGVISQNDQMRVLMWPNKYLSTLKRRFLIWSNKDPKIEVTHAQIEILNALCLKSIWVEKNLAIKKLNIVVLKWVWYKLYYFQKCQKFEKVWTRYSEICGGKKAKGNSCRYHKLQLKLRWNCVLLYLHMVTLSQDPNYASQ
jgi:hypothetical protein